MHKNRHSSVLYVLMMTLISTAAWAQTPEPIRLAPQNQHYFLFRGKVIPLIGSGEHYGSVINPDVDYHKYLATVEAAGLNYTRLFGGSYVEVPAKSFGILRNDLAPANGRFLAPWARSYTPGYAGGGNKFDLQRWNPEYFARLRDFLGEASRRGIVVELTLFSSQYNETQWQVSAFNQANNVNGTPAIDWKKLNTLDNGSIRGFQEQYTRKLVKEASAFDNVIFEIANEPWSDRPVLSDVVNPYLLQPGRDQYPNSIDLADKESVAWQAQVADWIRSEDKTHLIAQNYANFRIPVRSVVAGASIVNFHYAYPEAVQWNYGLGMALAYDETGFLGREDDAYRRQAWNFMLAGGSTFDQLDYSFSPGHEDGSDTEPNGPGGGSASLRKQLRVLREFLESFALQDMHPDLTSIQLSSPAVAHALSDPGHAYAVYLDGNGPAELRLHLPEGAYRAEWLDVKSGEVIRSEDFRHNGGDKSVRSPDFQNGIALRLKAARQGVG